MRLFDAIVVLVLGISLAGMVGAWHGRALAEREFSGLVSRAALPDTCREALADSAHALGPQDYQQ